MTSRRVPDSSLDTPHHSASIDHSSPPRPEAALALALIPGVGPRRWQQLIAEHGDVEAVLRSPEVAPRAQRAFERAAQLHAACVDKGVRLVTRGEARYPARLLSLPDPPNPLFIAGRADLRSTPSVAIVGTRKPSAAGRRLARRFARELADAGISIVSGMATGIDAEAHAGALDADGHTVAVLGTGVDVVYPESNRGLHARILEAGTVISESPPGCRVRPGAFPRRNRIIAALADFTLVVEAGVRSGALITAQVANAIVRPFGALPGLVDCAECEGSNRLLRDGAHVILDVDDVLSILSLPHRLPGVAVDENEPREAAHDFRADTPEYRILEVLAAGPQFADDLVRVAAASARDVSAALSILVMSGLVDVDASGLVARRSRG